MDTNAADEPAVHLPCHDIMIKVLVPCCGWCFGMCRMGRIWGYKIKCSEGFMYLDD